MYEKIIDEINRRLAEIPIMNIASDGGLEAHFRRATLISLRNYIESLEKEQPRGLDEAAEEYTYGDLSEEERKEVECVADSLIDAFKAGAEWMAKQGISFEDKVYPTTDWKGDIDGYCIDGTEEVDLMSEAVPKGLFQVGDKVIVQIRKK